MNYSIHYHYKEQATFIEKVGDDLEEAQDAFECVILNGQSSPDEEIILLMKEGEDEPLDSHPWEDVK
jgi:hypothetical protein